MVDRNVIKSGEAETKEDAFREAVKGICKDPKVMDRMAHLSVEVALHVGDRGDVLKEKIGHFTLGFVEGCVFALLAVTDGSIDISGLEKD